MKTLILALMLLAPKTEPLWLNGHLVAIHANSSPIAIRGTSTTFPNGNSPITVHSGRIRTSTTFMYTILTNDVPGPQLLIDAAADLKHSADVIENDVVHYRIDKHDLFILDNAGKKVKLRIVKMRKP